MTRPTRSDRRTAAQIPNKTRWALEDILVETDDAEEHWLILQAYAEKKTDTVLAVKLGRLRHNIANITKSATAALNGGYTRKKEDPE